MEDKGKLTTGKFYDEVRMNVNTRTGAKNWKNVEITGYAKEIQSLLPSMVLEMTTRLGMQEGANIVRTCHVKKLQQGGIYADGHVGWKKEIWFTGGYTTERAHAKVTDL